MLYARFTVWVWVKEDKDKGLTDEETDALVEKQLNESIEEIKQLSRIKDYEFDDVEVY